MTNYLGSECAHHLGDGVVVSDAHALDATVRGGCSVKLLLRTVDSDLPDVVGRTHHEFELMMLSNVPHELHITI